MRTEEIAQILRRAVRERVLEPGQTLNQDDLARRFGVSRIPLREALRTLAGEGLVVMRPGLGAVVIELDAEEVQELYELRLHIEPPMARAVVARVQDREIDELEELVTRMSRASDADPDEWSGLHYVFRRRFYELSGRRHSARLITQLLNLVESYSRYHAHVLGAHEKVRHELEAEVAAMRERNGELLAELVASNIREVRDALVVAMREDPQDDDQLAALFRDPP